MLLKPKNPLFFLIGLLFAVVSCKYSEEFRVVEKPGEFSIEVPDYIKALDDIGERSTFQYGNKFRNFYIIIESKDKAVFTNTEEYAQNSLQQLMSSPNLSEPDTLDLKPIENLNGLTGRHLTMTANIGNETVTQEVVYHLLHLESKDQFYHIALWTWADWQEKYKTVIPQILNSFREI